MQQLAFGHAALSFQVQISSQNFADFASCTSQINQDQTKVENIEPGNISAKNAEARADIGKVCSHSSGRCCSRCLVWHIGTLTGCN